MYRLLIFTFVFCSSSAFAEDCLQLQRDKDTLTFFYAKQDVHDKPYFYVKALMADDNQAEFLAFESIMSLENNLIQIYDWPI